MYILFRRLKRAAFFFVSNRVRFDTKGKALIKERKKKEIRNSNYSNCDCRTTSCKDGDWQDSPEQIICLSGEASSKRYSRSSRSFTIRSPRRLEGRRNDKRKGYGLVQCSQHDEHSSFGALRRSSNQSAQPPTLICHPRRCA